MIDEPHDVPATVTKSRERAADLGFDLACDDRTGALLRTLAASKPGGRLLEIGTGTGVGAAWLLAGMTPDARLTTIEVDPANAAAARDVFGADDRVDVQLADAAAWLSGYAGPPFDLVFADALPGKFDDRDLVMRHLAPGGFYVGDDLRPVAAWPDEFRGRAGNFRDEIASDSRLVVTLLDWSTGLVVAARSAAL